MADRRANAVTFAALGDIHGQIDRAVDLLRTAELKDGLKAAFVLQVGDLEAHRNRKDMQSMYAPHRQKRLGDFPAYWRRKKSFPIPMYFIGGNHESYQRLNDSPEGMPIAPNIHFLGRSGETTIRGLRIAYLTGIFDEKYYHRLPGGRKPVSGERDFTAQRFLACYTETEVNLLQKHVSRPDVLLVHEWPSAIVRPEDHEPQEPKHRHLRYGETGIPAIRRLVEELAPRLVLCGHMHRPYQAFVKNTYNVESLVSCLGRVDHSNDGIQFFSYSGQGIWQIKRPC